MSSKNIKQIVEECKADCGVKAVEMGFPANAGHDIFDTYMQFGFSEEKFIDQVVDQVIELQVLYGKTSRTFHGLHSLASVCRDIIATHGEQLGLTKKGVFHD